MALPSVLAKLTVAGVAVVVNVGVIGAAVAYHEGAAVVSIHEKKPDGVNLWLPVPVALVHAGVSFAPADEIREATRELDRWRPLVDAVLDELDRAPDAVFVEVKTPDEAVTVAKRHGRLVVDVDTHGETVHVSVPSDAVRTILDALPRHHRGGVVRALPPLPPIPPVPPLPPVPAPSLSM
jgi:hypothetical protein